MSPVDAIVWGSYRRAVPAAPNFVLAFVPTVRMAVKQTTTISASMTAYSTAVGPSSEIRNRFTLRIAVCMKTSHRTGVLKSSWLLLFAVLVKKDPHRSAPTATGILTLRAIKGEDCTWKP